jgi:cysteine desulfurase
MTVNNETGIIQPLDEICEILNGHDAFFHTDAAQGFGKEIDTLKNPRIDLISISGHKIYAPKGIGALVTRRRGYERIPLQPIMFGGGHEKGLRPGTLPVHLIVGLGKAADMAIEDIENRKNVCKDFQNQAITALLPIGGLINGDRNKMSSHVLNISFPGVDSEAAMVTLKDLVAISNGSACTSQSYDPSHVLIAMKFDEDRINGALRFSWCHMTPKVDWSEISKRIALLMK